jgi:tetratricopeptide (TPR) repeat protein
VFWRQRPKTRTELVGVADRARSRGRLKQAVAGYRKALEIAPGDLAIHAKLAPLLARRGEKPAAIASFELAADGQLKAGFIDRAVSLRRQAAETFPEEYPLWLELTRLHLLRDRRADAVAALRGGGRTLLGSRHREVGVQVLRLALEVEPRHLEATLLLARLLDRCGRASEALSLLDDLDRRAGGAVLRRVRRLAFRVSPTPGRLWRWAKASFGKR